VIKETQSQVAALEQEIKTLKSAQVTLKTQDSLLREIVEHYFNEACRLSKNDWNEDL
jgi:cell division protein FtsB